MILQFSLKIRKMKILNKFFFGVGIIVICIISFSVWYVKTYSMKLSDTYEINSNTLQKKLLIVTQGSEYKKAVVKKIIKRYRKQQMFIKVTDASYLPQINAEEWSAMIILHTWEIGKPPGVVKSFLYKYQDFDNLVIVTTSGGGNEKSKVDAISGASLLKDVNPHSEIIINRLNSILDLK